MDPGKDGLMLSATSRQGAFLFRSRGVLQDVKIQRNLERVLRAVSAWTIDIIGECNATVEVKITMRNLTVREDVYNKLLEARRDGESFSEVIDRLLRKNNLMSFAGIFSDD